MKSITVTKVGTLSIGKLFGTVNLIVAMAIGIVAAIVSIVTYISTANDGFFAEFIGALAIAVTALLLYPLVAFAFGWLYGVLVAFIFNVVIGVSGGVELETQDTPAKK